MAEHVGGACREDDLSLQGLGVVVTRPEHQAASLCALLETAGARVLRIPALSIEPLADPAAACVALARLARFDLVIFVSANAVEHALRLLGGRPPTLDWPRIAAVGPATAAALERRGLRVDLVPRPRHDSEALLALPELAAPEVFGRRVAIFSGEGGREVLARTLLARGARVDRIPVYRRVCPAGSVQPLLQARRSGEVDAIVVTSGEALHNLFELAGTGGRTWLLRTPLVVASERLASLAGHYGVRVAPVVASGAGDVALARAVGRLRRRVSGCV